MITLTQTLSHQGRGVFLRQPMMEERTHKTFSPLIVENPDTVGVCPTTDGWDFLMGIANRCKSPLLPVRLPAGEGCPPAGGRGVLETCSTEKTSVQ